jgi:metallo-beta-lactamase class B
MKRQVLHVLILLYGFCITVTCPAIVNDTIRLSDELTIHRFEPDFYLVVHAFPWPANALFVQLSDSDAVLIDTPYTNDATELLLGWIRQEFGPLRLRVINTHFHRDNLGGNGYLIQNGIPVYGSDLTVALLKERGDIMQVLLTRPEHSRYLEGCRNSPLSPPDRVFTLQKGLTWAFSNDSVEVVFPGAGHTLDNVVVYFPKHRILFGGCLIKSLESRSMGNTTDSDLKAWPESLRKLLNLYPGVRLIIHGHGECGDLALISHTLQLLDGTK